MNIMLVALPMMATQMDVNLQVFVGGTKLLKNAILQETSGLEKCMGKK